MALAEDIGIQDVEDVLLNVFGLEGSAGSNGEFRMLCPVHEQDGAGHSPSCDVNLTTGQWNCFSCSASGDIIGLGKIVLGRPRHKVLELLRPNEPTAMSAALQTRVRRKLRSMDVVTQEEEETFEPEIPPLGSYRGGAHPYLADRGFKKKILKHWGVRFARRVELTKINGETFTLRNNIAIPIVGPKGDVLCWCYRATENSDTWQQEKGKYIYTPGLTDTLNQTWFGLHEARRLGVRDIAVVEGALDCIWCWQNGIPAVAILGTALKQFAKVVTLTEFRTVTVLPDKDEAGMIASLKLGDRLQRYGTPVRIALYRDWMTKRNGKPATDPQDLCPLDLELFHFSAVPWQAWRSRPGVRELAFNIERKTKGKDAT